MLDCSVLPAAVYIHLLHPDPDSGNVPSYSHLPPSKLHRSLAAACPLQVLEFHYPGVVVKTFPTPNSPTRTPDYLNLFLDKAVCWKPFPLWLSSSCQQHQKLQASPFQTTPWPSCSCSYDKWRPSPCCYSPNLQLSPFSSIIFHLGLNVDSLHLATDLVGPHGKSQWCSSCSSYFQPSE